MYGEKRIAKHKELRRVFKECISGGENEILRAFIIISIVATLKEKFNV